MPCTEAAEYPGEAITSNITDIPILFKLKLSLPCRHYPRKLKANTQPCSTLPLNYTDVFCLLGDVVIVLKMLRAHLKLLYFI